MVLGVLRLNYEKTSQGWVENIAQDGGNFRTSNIPNTPFKEEAKEDLQGLVDRLIRKVHDLELQTKKDIGAKKD